MKSQEGHTASLKTLLEWHGADCKYSHKSKYPQLQSLRCPCLQTPGSAASGLPLPAQGRAVHMPGRAEERSAEQGGTGKPTEVVAAQGCERRLAVPVLAGNRRNGALFSAASPPAPSLHSLLECQEQED